MIPFHIIYHPKFSELKQLIISYSFCSWLCGCSCICAGWEARHSLEIRLGPQLEIFTECLGFFVCNPLYWLFGLFHFMVGCSTRKYFKRTVPDCKHLSRNNTLLVSHLTNIPLGKASHMANCRVITERWFQH